MNKSVQPSTLGVFVIVTVDVHVCILHTLTMISLVRRMPFTALHLSVQLWLSVSERSASRTLVHNGLERLDAVCAMVDVNV